MVPKIQVVKVETRKKVRLSMEIEDFFIVSTLTTCIFGTTAHCSNSLQRGCQNVPASLDWIHCNFLWNHSLTEFFELVGSKASHLESGKWAFCGIICNLLCKSWKIIHEKSRFKASKTWIIYFFECNGLFRVQNIPFNPKNLHIDFWFDTPLEQCAL